MTDYMDLRIALAKGECVTDYQGRVFRIDQNGDLLSLKLWDDVFKEWQEFKWLEFRPNSKVVPDPSVEKCQHKFPTRDGYCLECDAGLNDYELKRDTSPKSLTYQEALEAGNVTIDWPPSIRKQIEEDGFRAFINLAMMDIADRRGYLMQTVED